MKKNLILAVCFCMLLGIPAMADTLPLWDSMIGYGYSNGNFDFRGIGQVFAYYTGAGYSNWDPWNDQEQVNWAPPSYVESTGGYEMYIELDNNEVWTYAILAMNGSGSNDKIFYVFYNDYAAPGKDVYDFGDGVLRDLFLTTPGLDMEFEVDYWLITGNGNNTVAKLQDETIKVTLMMDPDGNNNNLDVTTWFSCDPTVEGSPCYVCTGPGCTKTCPTGWIDEPGFGCCDPNHQPGDFSTACPGGGEAPEPGTILLLGTGIIGLGFAAKRKMTKK